MRIIPQWCQNVLGKPTRWKIQPPSTYLCRLLAQRACHPSNRWFIINLTTQSNPLSAINKYKLSRVITSIRKDWVFLTLSPKSWEMVSSMVKWMSSSRRYWMACKVNKNIMFLVISKVLYKTLMLPTISSKAISYHTIWNYSGIINSLPSELKYAKFWDCSSDMPLLSTLKSSNMASSLGS